MSFDRYLALAEQCRTLSRTSVDPELRNSWLRLAEGWLLMAAEVTNNSPEAQFQAAAEAQSTGQKSSDASH